MLVTLEANHISKKSRVLGSLKYPRFKFIGKQIQTMNEKYKKNCQSISILKMSNLSLNTG